MYTQSRSRAANFFTWLILVTVLSTSIACQTAPTAKTLNEMSLSLGAVPPPSGTETTLRPGDVIEIKFPYAAQLNERHTIRPDGKIELQLVGQVLASGKTVSELGEELTRLHAEQLKHPEVTIIVHSSFERRVYVAGEVNKPGPVEFPGRITALEAVMNAGGFNLNTAEIKSVLVIRNKEEKLVGYTLNFKDYLSDKPKDPFYLEPRDVVYVPRTTIANVNQWIQQHFYKLLPTITYPL